jgi:hypothetical protein
MSLRKAVMPAAHVPLSKQHPKQKGRQRSNLRLGRPAAK